jgi:hypothetical protein
MPKKPIIQMHHCTYPDGRRHPPKEWIVPVTKGEHFILTRLQWLKTVSPGFVQALLYEVAQKPQKALEDQQT